MAGCWWGTSAPSTSLRRTILTNSTIRASAGFGIVAMWQSTVNNAPDLTATNIFTGNALCAQTFNTASGVCPSLGCTAP